ncbi:oligosaccharide flippase family protein [Flavobacterium sp. Sd200]|uniref:O-antigen translocase n=1 Tax=Flavobacterium sp. Sd200 TaxID=2692211 RepID=UPI001369DF27|nr:O-antigen translocase [Flavobacterium sp. Sd200]MXN92934.1 oligosaccharide flippase family protein [Flavobacterium sp. Sd200]
MYKPANIFKTQLFRVSSLNTLSIVVRIAGGLLASKMIALFIGPSGMALTGNLRNFLTSVDAFSTLGLQNGIIKYTAEHEKDDCKLKQVLATVCLSIFATVVVVSFLLLMLSSYFSSWIFNGNQNYSWVLQLLAVVLPFYTGSLVFVAILNGFGSYKQVIWINIFGNAAGVVMSAILIWQMGLSGAFWGIVLSPVLVFLFSLFYISKQIVLSNIFKMKCFDKHLLKKLLSYSLMSLVTALLGPVVYISIRNYIVEVDGAEQAGYWEAMGRIATFYMLFVSTLLTLYFLPKLSVAKTNKETKNIFFSYFKSIVPLYAVGLLVVYILRFFIVKLLFSADFLPMTDLFAWQLLGDFFKVCALILGFEFFAKKMTSAFILVEGFLFLVLYCFSKIFISVYGSEGAVMAHALTGFLNFILLSVYFKIKYKTL